MVTSFCCRPQKRDVYDANGDGVLDKGEFSTILQVLVNHAQDMPAERARRGCRYYVYATVVYHDIARLVSATCGDNFSWGLALSWQIQYRDFETKIGIYTVLQN